MADTDKEVNKGRENSNKTRIEREELQRIKKDKRGQTRIRVRNDYRGE